MSGCHEGVFSESSGLDWIVAVASEEHAAVDVFISRTRALMIGYGLGIMRGDVWKQFFAAGSEQRDVNGGEKSDSSP